MQVKDGASWSALEFAKWARENKTHKKPLVVLPAGIVYTDKAKYRSRVVVECVSFFFFLFPIKEGLNGEDPEAEIEFTIGLLNPSCWMILRRSL